MNQDIKFSIITVVKNGMPFFYQTIESVLSQSYENIEYIVIDGASTDGSTELIKKYAKKRPSLIWRSESDSGIADAFNKGLSLATGDYFLFLNSDDMLADSNILSRIAKDIASSHFPSVIYGDCELIDRYTSNSLYTASVKFSKNGMLQGKIFPHPSTFTAKRYFQKYGYFDPTYKIAMDYEFFLRGLEHEKIIHSSLLISKVRNGGISTKNQQFVAGEIISALKKNGYLQSYYQLNKLRTYFFIRRRARELLQFLGFYELLKFLRNKILSIS